MARGKIILVIVLSAVALFAAFIIIALWSFAKLMKEGAVDTLDSMNFHAQFSTPNTKQPTPTNNNAVVAESKIAPSLGSDEAPIGSLNSLISVVRIPKRKIRSFANCRFKPGQVWLQERNFPTFDDSAGALLHPGAQPIRH